LHFCDVGACGGATIGLVNQSRKGERTVQFNRRQILYGLLLAAPLCLVLARQGSAGPGDIEINQTAAMAGNVTPGDLPGFPIDINTNGNFLLTSPLDVSGEPNPWT